MPGTIQVTVLEFKGVTSSSMPSAKSLKVSMGKRQYQTWDKGDFSFPITKLREDLVVALLDAGGNEIAHQDIRTMQIIEKGSWDEVFSINGCGHVHMKLQFILSEEERNRIRIMRESAMKKKLETNPNIKLRLSEAISSVSDSVETTTTTKNEQKVSDSQKEFVEIDVVSPEVEASQAGSSPDSATSSAVSPPSAIPNATDGSRGSSSSPSIHETKIESPRVQERVPDEKMETQPVAHIRSGIKEGPLSMLSESSISDKNRSVVSKFQDPVEKTPCNVRKMISAFENSQLQLKKMMLMDFEQEVKSLKKASSVPSQSILEDQESKTVAPPADKTTKDFKDLFVGSSPQTPTTVSERVGNISSDAEPSQASKQLSSNVAQIPSGGNDPNTEVISGVFSRKQTPKELEKLPVDMLRQSTSETATSSGRMLNLAESSVAEGSGRGRGTSLKSSTTVVATNPKTKTLEYYKEECYSAQSSGMWIFPDNTRRLCITTAGKQVIRMVGHHHNEAKTTRQVKKISSEIKAREKNLMHETEDKMEKKQKRISDQPESVSDSSPHYSPNGLVGQVIKVAAIIGFGVLVLLTRQKEPRKKHKEEKDDLPYTRLR